MTSQELLDLHTRSIKKHHEIRAAMIGLEQKFILENSKYKIGDKILLETKVVRNKTVEEYGEVVEMLICYDVYPLPTIRTTINKDGKYYKTIRQEVN
jgi:hypothetical protein